MTRIHLLAGVLALAACQGPPMPEPPGRPDLSREILAEKPAAADGVCWTDQGPGWFRTPCPDEMTPELVSSLQRALAARDLHAGAITGRMDAATRKAVRRLQQPLGLDSDRLSLAAARHLGLLPVDLDTL